MSKHHHSPAQHAHHPQAPSHGSVLSWPAWRRVAAIAPVLVLLWLAVLWANLEPAAW